MLLRVTRTFVLPYKFLEIWSITRILTNEKFHHVPCHIIRNVKVSVLSLTHTSCDLKELEGSWTSVTSRDLNALCRGSEVPLLPKY